MKTRVVVLFFSFIAVLMAASGTTYGQIDSRNQARPDREQSASEADKKKKRDRKNRDKRRRLKGRKEAKIARKNARSARKKIYSNKQQIRENMRKTGRRRAKGVDRGFEGDITGRKISKTRNRNREATRTYAQPDPYKNRRIRTERSRAGPDAPKVRTATRRGERARTGDISGQRSVRQKSVRSARTITYPQPNPYVGREIKTEKQRAKSNRRQIRSVRSITRPAEANPPRDRGRSRRAPSISASSRRKVKQKRNVYRDHQRFGGEKSTNRDIAGRQLRTRNTRSAKVASPVPYSSINPYNKTKRYAEGQRYRRTSNRYSSARSISRSAESAANRRYDSRYGQHRNRRTMRTTGVVSAKRVRSTADPRRRGDRRIFGNKYQPGPTRSVSRGAESRGPVRPKGFVSISGRRKTYRQRNTYQGKDRHFGENSTTRDIAGRKLRTRNKRSFHPTWSDFGGGTYGTGSVSGKPTKKFGLAGGRRKSRANWNNSGNPIIGKGANRKGESSYTGRMPAAVLPSYGPGRASTFSGKMPLRGGYGPGKGSQYSGRLPLSAMPSYGPGKASTFSGKMTLRGGYGPGKASRYTGRLRLSTMPSYGPGKASTFSGRMPLRGGYGPGKGSTFSGRMSLRGGYGPGKGSTFSGRMPLRGGYGPGKASTFSGKMPLRGGYGPGKEGAYQGKRKGYRPLKGGGSITAFWNNGGKPLRRKDRNPVELAISVYKGDMPLTALPFYGDGKEGSYQGAMKARKPLKGAGGSITRRWNNNEQPIQGRGPGKYSVGRYSGNLPLSAMPSYGDGKAEASYRGKMKAKKPLKGAGGSITTQWNNDFQPIEGKGPGKYQVGRYSGNMPMSALPSYSDGKEGAYQGEMKRKSTKIKQSPGTEKGRTRALTFLRLGDPNKMGLTHREKNLKVKNDLPKELSRVERQRIEDADGMDRGRTQSLSFLTLGDPSKGGLRVELGNKKRKTDLPSEIKGKNRLRIQDAQGLDRGRTRSLTFLKLGDPAHGGLREERDNKQRKGDLPSEIKGKNRWRLAEADGMDNGRTRSFSFWAIGDPTRGGLVKSPAQARGRLHPSADYTKPGKDFNAVEKKQQPIKFKLWFAKLFKRNANQPDAVKEKERRPRYNKNEREIWETSEREDWYKN